MEPIGITTGVAGIVLFGELPVGRAFVSNGCYFEKISSVQAIYTEDNKCHPVDFSENDEVFVEQ